MIRRVEWRPGRPEEPCSPFERGSTERPVRLTFHRASFQDLTPIDAEAIEALSELTHLSDVEVLDTSPGDLPYIEIGEVDDIRNQILVRILDPDFQRIAGIPNANQLRSTAARILPQDDPESPHVQSLYDDLTIAGAHCSLGQDVLVTLSGQSLQHAELPFLRSANPRTPLEAARLVGLLLRSRDNYTYSARRIGASCLNRGLFYWVLCRAQLPSMWRYFSACVHAAQDRKDDTLYLGRSILNRSVCALQARDAIGFQFYGTQDNDTRAAIMYHFNYLTLLLAGAFDAQARVAHRAYGIEGLRERNAYLHYMDFRRALNAIGADVLCGIVNSPGFQDVNVLLRRLRNTIHGAGLPTTAHFDGRDQTSFVEVLPEHAHTIWRAADRQGGTEQWGLTGVGERVEFEPYTYASRLVTKCLELMDNIAAATDVVRLFTNNSPTPELQDGPPDDDVFNESIRSRLAVLG